MATVIDFSVKEKAQWCPGCGDFAILGALKQALSELEIAPHDTVVCSGIGCSSKLPHYVRSYGFESLHGRGLPVASGIKLANHKLHVVSVGGDGDGYGIGTAHFVHIMRRNYDLTYIVHDNQIYGLTTGQASPTSQLGMKTKTTPYGVVETPFNPLASAIIGGATFVSRVFAGDMVHMKDVIKQAIAHKGFALVDVLQPCVTFNKLNTYDFFKQRCYKLEDSGHDPADSGKALQKALEATAANYEKIPIGVFFKEERATYESTLPQIAEMPLVKKDLSKIDISHAYKEFE
ncbi:MAG: thiamine pyrophosphate-dependent enzyme [Candidatus Micrarchaeota archaeon]